MARQTEAHPNLDVGQKEEELSAIARHESMIVEGEVAKPNNFDEFGAYAKTDPVEIRLVKKLDLWMMVRVAGSLVSSVSNIHFQKPILWVMYFLNFLDRNAMINAKLDTMVQDLHLVGSQYNTCVSILFVGYLGGQIPSNMLLSRVRPSWYMGGMLRSTPLKMIHRLILAL